MLAMGHRRTVAGYEKPGGKNGAATIITAAAQSLGSTGRQRARGNRRTVARHSYVRASVLIPESGPPRSVTGYGGCGAWAAAAAGQGRAAGDRPRVEHPR